VRKEERLDTCSSQEGDTKLKIFSKKTSLKGRLRRWVDSGRNAK